MKRKCFILLCMCFLLALLPVTAAADIGPKPSVTISFSGIEGETVYGTLLSEEESTGPYSTLDTDKAAWQRAWDDADETERKFLEYTDTDGFYYLGFTDNCTDGELHWGYYPPQRFKVLLYFPERGEFAVSSEVCERYAFKSEFKCGVSGGEITAERDSDYTAAALGVAVRLLLTLVIELALALAFGFRDKRQLLMIFAANFVTQTGLNLALAYTVYKYGSWAEAALYILLELAIFIIEAAVYAHVLYRFEKVGKKRHPVLYALTANCASFGLGLLLAELFPSVF